MRKLASLLVLLLPAPALATLPEQPIILLGEMTDAERITFTSAIAARRPEAIVLAHSDRVLAANRHFLKLAKAEKVWPVGKFDEVEELAKRYGVPFEKVQPWTAGPGPNALRDQLWPTAEAVHVIPPSSRETLLRQAHMASMGGGGYPVVVLADSAAQRKQLFHNLETWETEALFEVDGALHGEKPLRYVGLVSRSAKSMLDHYHAHVFRPPFRQQRPIPPECVLHLVAINPSGKTRSAQELSSIGPMLVIQRRRFLVLSDSQGQLETELKKDGVAEAESLLLLGDHAALPPTRRPNPTPHGKDAFVETEAMTPTGKEPVSLAVGRLHHEDYGFVLLALARQRLLQQVATARPKALVVANPGDSLPLLETISRHTAAELANAGYDTTPLFGDDANRARVRKLLPEQTLFLWEGHQSTLFREYEIHRWPEPLQPSLIFLQSCLSLTAEKAHPFLERGACGVIGSPSRNYSASGGAFALAFMNAMLYDRLPAGAALRQAKNFLLCFSQLKQARLQGDNKVSGAPIRSAWGFTLWGDPLLQLPVPPGQPERPPIRHEVKDNKLLVKLPEQKHPGRGAGNYQTQIWPNARLAGIYRSDTSADADDARELVPLVFIEFHAQPPQALMTPRLKSRLPAANWVLSWDERRSCGYLLIRPRSKDRGTLRFDIEWEG